MRSILAKSKSKPGDRHGRLTVMGEAFRLRFDSGNARTAVVCQCDCNSIGVYLLNNVKRCTSSCGCLSAENTTERNQARRIYTSETRRIWRIWHCMKRRCYKATDDSYAYYGARGIGVCEDWRNDFAAFRDWALDHGYASTLTLDRRDNDADYSPTNCRWATWEEQENNRRNTMLVTFAGETKSVSRWCRDSRSKAKAATVRSRIRRGIDPLTALELVA